VRGEGGQVEVAERLALTGAYRLGDLCRLLCVFAQLLHLRDEDLVAAVGVGIAAGGGAKHVRRVVLHQAAEVLGEDLHAVRVDQLAAR